MIKFNYIIDPNILFNQTRSSQSTDFIERYAKKMGLEEMILLDNETLKYIIENYTSESGVRKLKEILFEIVGEINLDILKNFETVIIPEINNGQLIKIIRDKYFVDAKGYNKIMGVPITKQELVSAVEKYL